MQNEMECIIPKQWNKFYLKDVSFVKLMTSRIYNVLIVANPYDAFMLEDDGRMDEKFFNEYTALGLRYPAILSRIEAVCRGAGWEEPLHFDSERE